MDDAAPTPDVPEVRSRPKGPIRDATVSAVLCVLIALVVGAIAVFGTRSLLVTGLFTAIPSVYACHRLGAAKGYTRNIAWVGLLGVLGIWLVFGLPEVPIVTPRKRVAHVFE